MKSIEKSQAEDDSSPFDPLPDDVVLYIFRKIIDFESLCPCKLVSKRFNQITHKVDTIRFITKPSTSFNLFKTSIQSLEKFKELKSLSILIPHTPEDPYMVKCKINCGKKVDSFLFVSPNSVCHSNENAPEEEEDSELTSKKMIYAMSCLDAAMMTHAILMWCIKKMPLLEKVTLVDSGKTFNIFLNINHEMRKSVKSRYKLLKPDRVSKCYIPLLKLPVSGYVIKGLTVVLIKRDDLPIGTDTFIKTDDDDDSEDKVEAVFNEAVTEIFKKHAARFVSDNLFSLAITFSREKKLLAKLDTMFKR